MTTNEEGLQNTLQTTYICHNSSFKFTSVIDKRPAAALSPIVYNMAGVIGITSIGSHWYISRQSESVRIRLCGKCVH